MDCKTLKLKDDNQFITSIAHNDEQVTQFFNYNAMAEESYTTRLQSPNNGREEALAEIIEHYMSDLSLTEAQQDHISQLANGAKVVIGGQQAGFLGGALYTFHKILSIVTLTQSLREKYEQPVVPVFWIAGEDHDFDEVNHTYVFNHSDAQLHKVKYHTLQPPETCVSHYRPDKGELKQAVDDFFKQLNETQASRPLRDMCHKIIADFDSWSDIFKALVHEVFKEYGLLLIDAHDSQLRRLEQPMFKYIIEQHQSVDAAFRQGQAKTIEAGLEQMIQTDTNVHLFLEHDQTRELLIYEDGKFKLNKSQETLSKEELLNIVETEPERLSNNVVTRPVMEEWLFNTVTFVGGPSEIKYWAELAQVFKILDVEMPIVLPRMRISYLNPRVEKLLNRYDIPLDEVIEEGATRHKDDFVRAQASDAFINKVEEMKVQQEALYQSLQQELDDNHDNTVLLDKNNEIHQFQYDYLIQRYLLNIERENQISMTHFREIESTLHAMGGLQERIWNPLQIMNNFGIDVFSPSTYPPLPYTFDHIIVKP